MLIGQKGVKYGLQVRQPAGKPAAAPPPKKASVFGEDDSDDEQPTVEQQIARQAARKQTDKRVAEMHAAALAEDSSIFEYDAHHDSIQEARAEPKRQEKMARQSRYIGGLLEKAEERKREQDVLYERQLAKERAAEDHLFGDKERFVTAAYRKKLEEDAKFNEEQRRIREEEERNTVEKRGHMGDFYRNLLRNNVAFGTAQPAGKAGPGGAAAAAAAVGQEEGDDVMPERRAELEREREREREAAAARRAPGAAPAAPPAADAQPPVAARPAEISDAGRAEGGSGAPAPAAAAAAPGPPAGGDAAGAERRNKEDAVAAARERFLARKRKAAAGGG